MKKRKKLLIVLAMAMLGSQFLASCNPPSPPNPGDEIKNTDKGLRIFGK
ncbi:MAG TPA: hypothetical protein VIR29_09295 [Anseongella sp.]